MTGPETVVLGWGTALPAYRYSQAELGERLAAALPTASGRRLRAAFRGSRIESRGSVLPDFAQGAPPRLFRGPAPGTAARMAIFAQEAPGLASAAARDALHVARIDPASVTHLLFVTCTGLVSPGPDRDLVASLELSPTVRRVQIGFQGCSAGIVALRTAAEIVRGEPSARVLVTAVELASLHFQPDPADDDLRGHALFADGAGAALVAAAEGSEGAGVAGNVRAGGERAGREQAGRADRTEGGRIVLGAGASRLLPATEEDMTWHVADTGFLMRLSAGVPAGLAAELPRFVAELVGDSPGAPTHWAVHPGGPVVLDRIREALGVPEDRLAASREILRTCGNMSSATIFFVMERLARDAAPGGGLALAFGPGLTIEGLRFRVVR